jgi:hypothetical protein
VPTQVVQHAEAPRRGFRFGRTAWIGLGAAVVAAAVAAYLVIADPFAGPLPDGWKTVHEKDVTATLAVPDGYEKGVPDRTSDDSHWVSYTDPSGALSIVLSVERKAEDTGDDIKDSAAAEMYDDNGEFKDNGSYRLDMPKGPRTQPDGDATFHGRKAAENTVTYTTDDTQNPRPRELRIFYYKSSAGDMYRLTIAYPGKGDFTERGREVARTAIANLDLDKL